MQKNNSQNEWETQNKSLHLSDVKHRSKLMGQEMSSALVLGATGLCGSAIVKHALESHEFTKVMALVRRLPENVPENVEMIVNSDIETWPKSLPQADVVFSALGTTFKAAGSLEAQRKIDRDMNLEIAKAAKANGTKAFVMVSAVGAHHQSCLPYSRMKGELEQSLEDVGFDTLIILQPGALLGERPSEFSGLGQPLLNWFGGMVYRTQFQWLAAYPIHGDEVGKAAVSYVLRLGRGVYRFSSSQMLEEVNPETESDSLLSLLG